MFNGLSWKEALVYAAMQIFGSALGQAAFGYSTYKLDDPLPVAYTLSPLECLGHGAFTFFCGLAVGMFTQITNNGGRGIDSLWVQSKIRYLFFYNFCWKHSSGSKPPGPPRIFWHGDCRVWAKRSLFHHKVRCLIGVAIIPWRESHADHIIFYQVLLWIVIWKDDHWCVEISCGDLFSHSRISGEDLWLDPTSCKGETWRFFFFFPFDLTLLLSGWCISGYVCRGPRRCHSRAVNNVSIAMFLQNQIYISLIFCILVFFTLCLFLLFYLLFLKISYSCFFFFKVLTSSSHIASFFFLEPRKINK